MKLPARVLIFTAGVEREITPVRHTVSLTGVACPSCSRILTVDISELRADGPDESDAVCEWCRVAVGRMRT